MEGEKEVFGLKLRIQHLEERLSFVGGGTDTEQLLDLIQEKDEELKKKVGQVKVLEETIQKLVEGGKKLNDRQRDLERAYTAKKAQTKQLESEVADQLEKCKSLENTVREQEDSLAHAAQHATQQEASLAELTAQSMALREEMATLQGVAKEQARQLSNRDDSIRALKHQTEALVIDKQECEGQLKMSAALADSHREALDLSRLEADKAHKDHLGVETELKIQAEKLEKELQNELARHQAAIDYAKKNADEQKKTYEAAYRDVEKQMKEVEQTGTKMVGAIEKELEHLQGQCQAWVKEKGLLKRQMDELRRTLADKERKIGVLERSDKKWADRLQSEMSVMRADLVRHQGLRSEVARLQSEKCELEKRVKSQDAYMKRKLQEKRSFAPGVLAASSATVSHAVKAQQEGAPPYPGALAHQVADSKGPSGTKNRCRGRSPADMSQGTRDSSSFSLRGAAHREGSCSASSRSREPHRRQFGGELARNAQKPIPLRAR
ncbi:unnamed protein product [Chrysoparadoxa australica]